MSLWRRTAIEMLPEHRRQIADADSCNYLLLELRHYLEEISSQMSLDEDFVSRAFAFASWCLHHRSWNIQSAAVLSFYEDLADSVVLRKDLARWMSENDFLSFESAWHYVLKSDEAVDTFQREFFERKRELGEERRVSGQQKTRKHKMIDANAKGNKQ